MSCPKRCRDRHVRPGVPGPVAAGPLSDADALEVAMRLKALADPMRVKIMSLLFSSRPGRDQRGAGRGTRPGRIHGQPSPRAAPQGWPGDLRSAWHERLSPGEPRSPASTVCGARPELLPVDDPAERPHVVRSPRSLVRAKFVTDPVYVSVARPVVLGRVAGPCRPPLVCSLRRDTQFRSNSRPRTRSDRRVAQPVRVPSLR